MGIFSAFSKAPQPGARPIDRAPGPAITAQRRQDRTIDELIGICRGILFDGAISTAEAASLRDWLLRNANCAHTYPFTVLLTRLHDALLDGVIDEEEEKDLLFALSTFVGGEADGEHGSESASKSSELPLDNPPPSSIDHASMFVVTGTFAFGSRAQVISEIQSRGGSASSAVSRKVRYLVVGEIGSRDWIHSSYGRKIEKAVELRGDGVPIAIVSERHWKALL